MFFRIKTLYLGEISESKLHIFFRFPNQNSIFGRNFRIKTTYFFSISESKLHIFFALPNQNSIFVRIKATYLAFFAQKLWKTSVEKTQVSVDFRMKATYFSTTSESKLYIFPQLPNQSYILVFGFLGKQFNIALFDVCLDGLTGEIEVGFEFN